MTLRGSAGTILKRMGRGVAGAIVGSMVPGIGDLRTERVLERLYSSELQAAEAETTRAVLAGIAPCDKDHGDGIT
jgi:hypothetical protein